ncbi:MAG: site-specific integrase [Bacteroidetes bacterium]|nr:site-specific integrase [Bacteroidota bacterium]
MLEEKFIRYITFEKRYSKHTIIAYQADLVQFYQYINIQFGSVDNKDITHFYVRSWIVTLMDSGMDARSVNRKTTSLKSYFKFLSKNNLIEHNPMLKIQGPKTSKKTSGICRKKQNESFT